MITIDCPNCGKSFDDYCGEHCSENVDGCIIDYGRYYECPHCGTHINIETGEAVSYDDIKDLD